MSGWLDAFDQLARDIHATTRLTPAARVLRQSQRPAPGKRNRLAGEFVTVIDVEVAVDDVPMRFSFGSDEPSSTALFAMCQPVQDVVIELTGRAWPGCPGHDHPMTCALADTAVWWTCPADGARVVPVGALSMES